MTDSLGALVWRPEYEPFGKSLAPRTNTVPGPGHRFPGQWEARASIDLPGGDTTPMGQIAALTDNWHRTYVQRWGRYSQPDPIGATSNQGGLRLFPARQVGPVALPSPGGNLFSYAEGSPTRLIDPTGEQAVAWALPAAAGCAVADGPLPVGDVIGAILLTGAVVYDATRDRTCDSCESRGCRPCIPPVGTLAHRPMDTPARPQHGISGPHYNMYQMNQSPWPMCICFWRKLKAIPPPLPPGAMPIVPAGGGGPL